ncbi:MAG: HAD hydrolase family protein [Solobacterium sp.]|nr:HAD hydrolase family protein [Solobacterium sp.]
MYDYCLKNGLGLLWKYPDLTYEYIHADIFEQFYNKTKDSRKKVVFDDKLQHYKRLPNGGCIGSNAKEANIFNAVFAKRCVAIKIDDQSSDLVLHGVSKLTGVKEVLAKHDISLDECVGFGDNNNDIEILSQVGISVAVSNGSEQLKEKVTMVTDDINDDGIYKALVKLHLI